MAVLEPWDRFRPAKLHPRASERAFHQGIPAIFLDICPFSRILRNGEPAEVRILQLVQRIAKFEIGFLVGMRDIEPPSG